MNTRTILVVASGAALAAGAWALGRCAILPVAHGRSASKEYRIELKREGTYTLYRKTTKGEVIAGRGEIEAPGHHPSITIDDQRKWILIVDHYAGYAVYDGYGKSNVVSRSTLLTAEEQRAAPGKWACHREGRWLKSHEVKGDILNLTLHSGRVVTVDLNKVLH